MAQAIVIGAGIGWLTTAAFLAHAGLDVTGLEAEVYPAGPMDRIAQAAGIEITEKV